MSKASASRSELRLDEWVHLRYQVGTGLVKSLDGVVRLTRGEQDGSHYCNAQLDDYSDDDVMNWRPPIRMTVRARFSHAAKELRGTAGFGFWNDPLTMTKTEATRSWLPRFRLPQAAWFFFAALPSSLPWKRGVPGMGWKAATLDASSWLAKILLPFAPVAMGLCHWRWAYARLWPIAERVLKIDERELSAAMDTWHEYRMEWEEDRVRYSVDGEVIHTARSAPRGPLGLVVWIDNQYMVATPQGMIRHGVVSAGTQWLELAALEVTS
jgi:Glycosyl hydrolases family 16